MSGLSQGLSRRKLLAFAASLVAGLPAGPAFALSPQEEFVKTISSQIISLANSGGGKAALRKKFQSLISRYSDVNAVAMLALGSYRNTLPAKRRGEFVSLVGQYIAAFFVYYIDEFQGTGLEIKSSSAQGKSTVVDSRITKAGPVKWRISGSAGNFRVLDMNVRAIWLSLQLKQRFTDVLKHHEGNFEALFAELKKAENW